MGAIVMVYWSLLVLPCVAALETGSDLTLEIVSVLSPIVSLFGDQFATQYLSQSVAWYDHVILAMVPIGIVTIIIGVIRVTGPQLAKSFIGRARETRAMTELELMSSVSSEVCEVFKQGSIVRTMGKSNVSHFLIYPSTARELSTTQDKAQRNTENGDDSLPFDIHTLKTAMKKPVESSVETAMEIVARAAMSPVFPVLPGAAEVSGGEFLTKEEYRSYYTLREILCAVRKMVHGSREDTEAQQPPTGCVNINSTNQQDPAGNKRHGISEADAPDDLNIQLNLTRPTVLEATIYTSLAIMVQLGLLAIAGLSGLYSPIRNATGFEPQRYALPCYFTGSLFLSLGVGICSYVIGESTDEHVWRTPEKMTDKEKPHLFFVQAKQNVQDNEPDSFVISAGKRTELFTSKRFDEKLSAGTNDESQKPHSLRSRTLSLIGVFMTGLGFIAQYIGLRGLSYPCTVAHLGATFVMVGLRTHFRRAIGHRPETMNAVPGFELVFLATYVVLSLNEQDSETTARYENTGKRVESFIENWEVSRASPLPIRNGNAKADFPTLKETVSPSTRINISQRIVWTHKRMGNLLESKPLAFENSLALGRSIENFMETFVSMNVSGPIHWKIPVSSKEPNDDFVTIGIKRRESGAWTVEVGDMEAVISMWMAVISQKEKNAQKQGDWRRSKGGINSRRDYVRSLGPDPDRRLERDLRWWVDGLPSLQRQVIDDKSSSYQEDEFWIGHHLGDERSCRFETLHPSTEDPMGLPERITAGLYCKGVDFLPKIMSQHLFTLFLWKIAGERCLALDCLRKEERDVEMANSQMLDPHALRETWHRPLLRHRKLTNMVQELEFLGLGRATDILLCIIPVFSFYDLLPNHIFLENFCNASLKFNWEDTLHCYTHMARAPMGVVANEKTNEQFVYAMVARVLDLIELVVEPYEEDSFKTFQTTQPSIFTALKQLVSELNTRYQHVVDHLALVLMVQGRAERFKFIFERPTSLTNMQSPPLGEGLEKFITRGKETDYLSCFNHMQEAMMFSDSLAFVIIILWDGMGSFETVNPDTIRERIRKALDDTKHYIIQWSDWEGGTLTDSDDSGRKDIFGWTTSHYRMMAGPSYQPGSSIQPLIPYISSNGKLMSVGEQFFIKLLRLSDNRGRNPFHVGCLSYYPGAMRKLWPDISQNKRYDALLSSGKDRMNLLHIAIRYRRNDCIDWLLPKRSAKIEGQIVSFQDLEWPRGYCKQRDLWGRDARHLAAQYDAWGTGRQFLESDIVEKNREDFWGKTFLQHSLRCMKAQKPPRKFEEDPRLLIRFLEKLSELDLDGKGKLHLAAEGLDSEVFQSLLDKYDPPIEELFSETSNRETVLDCAILSSNPENALIILDRCEKHLKAPNNEAGESGNKNEKAKSLSPTSRTGRAKTASLIHAFRLGHKLVTDRILKLNDSLGCQHCVEIVYPIMRHIGLPHTQDQNGVTPLLWACANRWTGTVKNLLNMPSVDPNMCSGGLSPLHIVVGNGNKQLVEELLKHGKTIPTLRLEYEVGLELTPLELAARRGKVDIVGILGNQVSVPSSTIISLLQARDYNEDEYTQIKSLVEKVLPNDATEFILHLPRLSPGKRLEMLPYLKDAMRKMNWHPPTTLKLPCHLAAQLGDLDQVERFLQEDADLGKLLDADGWSWLDYWDLYSRPSSFSKETLPRSLRTSAPKSDPKPPWTFLCADTLEYGVEILGSSDGSELTDIKVKTTNSRWSMARISTKEPIKPSTTRFYFEIQVSGCSAPILCGLGFCDSSGAIGRMPGWDVGSWAVHGNYGEVFHEHSSRTVLSLGEKMIVEPGDTLGCGMDLESGSGYCSRNGNWYEIDDRELDLRKFRNRKMYPCVGMSLEDDHVGLHLRVNLGLDQDRYPFKCKLPSWFAHGL